MSVIENFAVLSPEEQIEFATALVKTINSESTFISNNPFEITGVEADDITGGLTIDITHANPIEVRRDASWTCESKEDAEDDPGFEADYEDFVFEDAKKAFKTLSTEIDGYTVTLEVVDADDTDTVAVEVYSTSNEDSGIGSYEYWGDSGYDSHPYVEVSGTIVKACECVLALNVEPSDTIEAAEPESEEV